MPTPSMTNSSSNTVNYQLSADPEFAFVLETFLSLANGGGVSTGEILRAASQITPGKFESFYQEFKFLADQMYALGKSSDPRKHPVSVRNAMFRASSYYRAADFFLHGNQDDPRIYSLWDSQTAAFNQAMSLLDIPGERVNATTSDGFYVPVIFYKASRSRQRRPTILVGNGYDGAQEDSYHMACTEILARGWNCATYEGPGQPTVRRDQKIGFINEWWNVVTPVVHYLDTRHDVDCEKLALVGISFGGSLAPIAASHEHRFKAIIANDGIYNLGQFVAAQFSPAIQELFASGNSTAYDTVMNEIRTNATTSTEVRWFIDQGLFAFNTTSPFDWMTRFQAIGLEGFTDSITSPVFVGAGQDDDDTAGQPQILADALGEKAHYVLFATDVGAGEHCQIGAWSQFAQSAFDWVATLF